MAIVIITAKLEEQINKIFKKESIKILESMRDLENNPKKGTAVGQVSGTVIKEIRHESYRFYFITDGYKIKVLSNNELSDLLIKFVRMSNKKDQQKVIEDIKKILRAIGETGFDV